MSARCAGWGGGSPRPPFSAASAAHFLSPPNPTTPARTRAHTLPGGPAASLRAQRSRPQAWGKRRSALLLFKSHPRRAPWPQALQPGESIPRSHPPRSPRTATATVAEARAPAAESGIPRSPGLRRAAPPPPPERAAARPPAPAPSRLPSPPPPLPFSGPVSVLPPPPPPSPVRGGPPAALPAAWHHPGSISREQRSGPAGSPGAGGAPAASVMDVNKMVSQEPGPLPWSLGVPVPPPPSPAPSQSVGSIESFCIVDPAVGPNSRRAGGGSGARTGGGWRTRLGSPVSRRAAARAAPESSLKTPGRDGRGARLPHGGTSLVAGGPGCRKGGSSELLQSPLLHDDFRFRGRFLD